MITDNKLNTKIIFALTLVHFTGDFYSSFTGPLLPVFTDKLSLSMAQVGILTGIIRLLSFIVQPCVGYLADRYQTRVFILGGLFLTIFFIPLSGIAPNFYILTLVLGIGAIGSSMFHPSVTGMIPLYSGLKTSFCMSIFNTGGTLAFGIGPVFISLFVAKYELERMPYTMVIGAIFFLLCLKFVPKPVSEGFKNNGFLGSIKETLGDVWKPIVLIWVVMVLRAVTGQSFMTFMPVYLANSGCKLVSVGFIVAIFILAGTLSGLTAGFLADKLGFKRIFLFTHALMTPALLLYLYLPGHFVYAGSFLAGFFVLATMPLGVVMAQNLAPKGRSMVSSLMMGFAYGLGGAVSPFIGRLADIYSIQTVLFYTAFVPVLTLPIIAKFPSITQANNNM
ncbi:MAG: MFS transporter [Thermodesulfobacteriota bacterium]|nr:MFS transporter [Thermodesulfobacteriota bacterium]